MKKIILIALLGMAFAGQITERVYLTPTANGKYQSATMQLIGSGNIISVNNTQGLTIKAGSGGVTVNSKLSVTGTDGLYINSNSSIIQATGTAPTTNYLKLKQANPTDYSWNIAGNLNNYGEMKIYKVDNGVEKENLITVWDTPVRQLEVAGTVSANEFGSAWTSFTPTVNTAVITFNTAIGYYKVVGKTVFIQASFYCSGQGGSAGGAGTVYVGGLPFLVNAPQAFSSLGQGMYATDNVANGTNSYPCSATWLNATGYNMVQIIRNVNSTVTGTQIGAGAYRALSVNFAYERP
jgi:hypothetical protein